MEAKRVLVVEDSKVIQRLIEVCLRPANLDVAFRDDGVTGLAAAIDQRPDLVVLDIGLPGLNGWEVLEALRSDPDTEDIEVLILSAGTDDEVRRRAAGLGAHILAKPFRPDELRDAVTHIAGPARADVGGVTGGPLFLRRYT
jgi:CheY-like chemotaxis protein